MSDQQPGQEHVDEPGHDQDAEPPTPFGEEPDHAKIDPDDSTPASHPDPLVPGT